jgi:hypothetical protein
VLVGALHQLGEGERLERSSADSRRIGGLQVSQTMPGDIR